MLPDISGKYAQTYTTLPIFILDGFQVNVEKVYNLDINRVRASRSQGRRGIVDLRFECAANGVVVIATKMPKKGSIQISYTLNTSVESPDLSSYNLMNSKELVQYYEKMKVFSSSNGTINGRTLERRNSNLLMLLKRRPKTGVDTYCLLSHNPCARPSTPTRSSSKAVRRSDGRQQPHAALPDQPQRQLLGRRDDRLVAQHLRRRRKLIA